MNDSKPFWASKTLWVNFLALVASLAAGFGLDISGEEQTAMVGGVLAVINIGLRLFTTRPIEGAGG